MGSDDYYAVLGVSRADTLHGIQAAYRKLAKQWHPDRAGMEGKEQFQALQEAYEVLSDPERRRTYDAQVARRRRMGEPRAVSPEPFATPRSAFRVPAPEPLITPVSPPEELTAQPRSPCPFCNGVGGVTELSCPSCRRLDLDQDMTRWIMSVLGAWRVERF